MDTRRFDALVRTLGTAGSRRSALRALLGAAFGVASGLLGLKDAAAACATNGTRCGRARDAPCCSGICKRRRGTHKRFCRAAPNQGICTTETNACFGTSFPCQAGPTFSCNCYGTKSGTAFYGQNGAFCQDNCSTDAACAPRGQGARCLGPETLCCADGCVPPCDTPA